MVRLHHQANLGDGQRPRDWMTTKMLSEVEAIQHAPQPELYSGEEKMPPTLPSLLLTEDGKPFVQKAANGCVPENLD